MIQFLLAVRATFPLRRLSFVILFTSSFLEATAQFKSTARETYSSKFYKEYHYQVAGDFEVIDLDFQITSLAISCEAEINFSELYIVADQDTFRLSGDHEPFAVDLQDKNKIAYFSSLVIFNAPVRSFTLLKGTVEDVDLHFHFLNTGATPQVKSFPRNGRVNEYCGKPYSVDQLEWRVGLPPPANAPSYTTVKHLIIHHSAGSNTNTDYTYVVRQIYLYHVEVRKYSDVAYNFLIAQDGTIYQGREGQGENEEDALGAHFCAKNSETMGVCLLGNYETALPTQQSLLSLKKLTAWKLKKENLDPFASLPHPSQSSTPTLLGIIEGHRAGCSTECPGANVYSRLEEIKEQVDSLMQLSQPELPLPQIVANKRNGPGEVRLEVSGGTEYVWSTSPNPEDSIAGANRSIFITDYLFQDSTFYVATKTGGCLSVFIPITAKIEIGEVAISPNPASSEVTVLLPGDFSTYSFSLYNSIGQNVPLPDLKGSDRIVSFNVSNFSSGVYILKCATSRKLSIKTLVVN